MAKRRQTSLPPLTLMKRMPVRPLVVDRTHVPEREEYLESVGTYKRMIQSACRTPICRDILINHMFRNTFPMRIY